MQPNKQVCSIILRPYCSNNCVFCRPLGENSKLTVAELTKIEQDTYQSLEEFRNKGYRNIEVSGGDPLEYERLPQLIKIIRKRGFEWVRLSTNGVRLSDVKLLDKLMQCGIDVFRIPLYGPTPQIHDAITRAKGSFHYTIKGIKNIKKNSQKTNILLTCLLLKQNASSLTAVFDLMHNLGCNDLYFAPPFVSNDDYTYYIPHKMQGYFFRKLIKHALKSKLPIRFRDLPYCITGFDNEFTVNTGKPAHLGSRFQPPAHQNTGTIDLPSYRKKIKIDICKKCAVAYKCDGFISNDILKYGIGDILPIL